VIPDEAQAQAPFYVGDHSVGEVGVGTAEVEIENHVFHGHASAQRSDFIVG
jgi:hypothetical protein